MKSTVVNRSIILAGHKTSVSLEDAFWRGLKDIATNRRMTMSDLVSSIDLDRQQGNLSSALGTIGIFVCEAVFRHASTKRSLNITANCVFASNHSRGGRFQSAAA